jgi:uncharacterized protein GlcG (DUF336 family)
MKKLIVVMGILALSAAVKAKEVDVFKDGALLALEDCRNAGFSVAVSVVDISGNLIVFIKDDGSTVHTRDTSFRKAYTVVTLGPIFKKNTSTDLSKEIIGKPSESSFVEIPNIALMSGAVALVKQKKIVAAIGVGGAPGGDKDEACALKGAQYINYRINKDIE